MPWLVFGGAALLGGRYVGKKIEGAAPWIIGVAALSVVAAIAYKRA